MQIQHTSEEMLQQGTTVFKSGDLQQAGKIFYDITQSDPQNQLAWCWLAQCVAESDKQYCLQRIVDINPNNDAGKRAGAILSRMISSSAPSIQELSSQTMSPSHVDQPSRPPSSVGNNRSSSKSSVSDKKPWYFSPVVLVMTFLFLTPLWVILIMADRKQGVGVKIVATFVGLLYVMFFGANLLSFGGTVVSNSSQLGTIEFGADFRTLENSFEITDDKSEFVRGEQFAYVAHLSRPVGALDMDVVISSVDSNGSESVVLRETMNVADPNFTVFANKFPLFLYEPGTYRLRMVAQSGTLAQGDFVVVTE